MLTFADSLFSVITHCNCTLLFDPDANRIFSRIIPASPNCWQSPRFSIASYPIGSALLRRGARAVEHASAVPSFCAKHDSISFLSIYPSESLSDTSCLQYSVTFNLSPLPTHAYQAPRFNTSTSTSSAMPPCSVAVANPLRASLLVPLHPSAFTGHTPPFHCHAHCGGEPEMNLNGILLENCASKTTYTPFF